MLAAGRALLVVREHVPHGDWRDFLSRLGLEPRLAQRMSQAALKFSNASTSTHLIEAAGNKSKLIELLVLDDDQVAELNDGGTVAGITLDDVAAMSVSDLRKALREARADAEANDKLLAEKNDQIDTLKKERDAATRRIKAEKPDEQLVGLHTKSKPNWSAWRPPSEASSAKAWRSCARRMSRTVRAMRNARLIAASLRAIQQQIGDLFTEFSLPQDDGDAMPAWARTSKEATMGAPPMLSSRKSWPTLPCLARCAARAGEILAGAARLQMSQARLYRLLGDLVTKPTRKRRSDAGKTALPVQEAQMIAAVLLEHMRKNGKMLKSVEAAVEVLRANNMIEALRINPATGEVSPVDLHHP